MAQQTPRFTCCAWPPPFYFSLPHLAQVDKRYKEAKGNGNGLKRCWPKRKAGQRALFVFLFSLPDPSSLGCSGPAFQCYLSSTFFQLLLSFMSLCWLRASGGCCSQAPGSSFALVRALMSSGGDELLSWEHSSVWSFAEKKVSSSLSRLSIVLLPPLSIPGGYFGISVCVNSCMT